MPILSQCAEMHFSSIVAHCTSTCKICILTSNGEIIKGDMENLGVVMCHYCLKVSCEGEGYHILFVFTLSSSTQAFIT